MTERPTTHLENTDRAGSRPGSSDRPPWISDDLIALTLKVWQPFYRVQLTIQDAVGMIVDAGRLIAACTARRIHGEPHALQASA
jgi:hypothetical protein